MLVKNEENLMSGNDAMAFKPYERAAIYSYDADCVEYVRTDSFCLYERIDSRLTLIKDATGHNLIGFKIKGFRMTFERLRAAHDLSDRQFVTLVSAFEDIYTEIGEAITGDPRVKAAYQAAYRLAANDNVTLSGGMAPLALAA
jgi:hypothetical protein